MIMYTGCIKPLLYIIGADGLLSLR